MRVTVIGIVSLFALASGSAAAPQDTKVGEGLYAYISDNDSSCNSVFLVSPEEGILVVDTGFDGKEAAKLLAQIRKVSNLRVRYIVNTHYHRDHQAGNGIIGPEAVILSTGWTRQKTLELMENMVPRLEKQLTGADLESLRSTRFRPANLTFDDGVDLYMGKHRVKISHPGKAHTSGDALVYFPQDRVMATADLFLTRSSPAMDQGSVSNWIEALKRILDGPAETFVPGHFELATKKELRRLHDYLADLYDQVERLVAAGASIQDVRGRIDLKSYADFRQYPRFGATFADNAEVIYKEITAADSRR